MKKIKIFILMMIPVWHPVYSQHQVIEEVIAVVGNTPVLRSELDVLIAQLNMEEAPGNEVLCFLLKQLLTDKMLIHQAEVDSVIISEERINADIENKIRFYESQLGSRDKLEKYLGMSILEYKKQIAPRIRKQMLVEEMREKILTNVKITPREVRKYFEAIPIDSLPRIGSEVEVAQIVINPKVSEESKRIALEEITEIRKRVLKGESFAKLATFYSEDPASKMNGGRMAEFGRNEMVGEFERKAFKLKIDSISDVFETSFGFHFMQLLDRRGERVQVRHILIRPKITSNDIELAKIRCDSVLNLIDNDTFTFCELAKKYSDHTRTKSSCGFFLDPNYGTTKVPMDYLEKDVALALADMKPGDISRGILSADESGQRFYRIVYLKSETSPHIANLEQDWQKIQQAAEQEKKAIALEKWVEEKRKQVYIRVDMNYVNCEALEDWNNNKF